MATADIIRGFNGRVKQNGANVNAERFRLSGTADDIPAMGFEDVDPDGNLYDAGVPGVIGAALQVSGYWSSINNPHADPPSIRTGVQVPNIFLYVNKVTNRFFAMPSIRILGCDVASEIKGRVDLSYNAKTNGKITYPI